jgi:hypothetical protein
MARGFESKDVEFQQAEANRPRSLNPGRTQAERETEARTKTITLALTRAQAELITATKPAHRRMLEQAISALEQQLRQ